MPNWNFNNLKIECSLKRLVDEWWLIQIFNEIDDQTLYAFNLHKLFPEQYPEEYAEWEFDYVNCEDQIEKANNTFSKYWNYNWCVNNLWTKWICKMSCYSKDNENFETSFDTARNPPNLLLERFHELSWINLTNEYEEPGNCFQWELVCTDWDCIDNEEEYIETCEHCDEKDESADYHDEFWWSICDKCLKEQWLIRL